MPAGTYFGGTSNSGGNAGLTATYKVGCIFTCPETAVVYAGRAWISGGGTAQMVIYSSSGTKIATSNSLTSPGTPALTDFTFPSPPTLTAAIDYLIAVYNSSGTVDIGFETVGGFLRYYNNEGIAGSTFGSMTNAANQRLQLGIVLEAAPVYFGDGTGAAASGMAANFAYFFQATCTQTGNVTDGRVGFSSSAGSGMKMGIYSVVAGAPGVLLGESSPISLSGAAGVRQLVFPTPVPVVNGTSYFLSWIFDSGPTLLTTATGPYFYKASTYPTFPTGSGATSASGLTGNLQAGVTAAGGAGPVFVPLIVAVI